MPGRHKWRKLREHVYQCTACGCGRENRQTGRTTWEAIYHLPSGVSVALPRRPVCEPGPRTEAYLAKYRPDLPS